MRAPDLGYAPRFLRFSVTRGFFHFGSESTLPPQAGNASRWAAERSLSIEIETFVSGDDFREALMLHTSYPKRKKVLLAWLVGSLFVLAILLFLWGSGLGILLFIGVGAYILRDLIMRNIFLPENSLRSYAEQKILHAPQRIVFSQDDISISSQHGQNAVPWPRIMKWRENERYLLLYQTDDQYLLLPKRDLADKREDLLVLLEQNRIPMI